MDNKLEKSKSVLYGAWPLCGAAFSMSMTLSLLWTSMPFVIRDIGGTEGHVGYAWAANMFAYMVFLVITGLVLGKHNSKDTTRISVGIIFASILSMSIIVMSILMKGLKGNLILIWSVIASGVVSGAALSLFWPFLMSWVSEGIEGPALNRRLGMFNGAWSGAAVIGPLIGGFLVEIGTALPIFFAAGVLVICFTLLNIAGDSSVRTKIFGIEPTKPIAVGPDIKAIKRFRWIARIGLFSSWACLGVTRSQFALLFTDMGFSETWFGVLVTIFGVLSFSIMILAGRYAFWHFKVLLLIFAQILLAFSLFMIIYGNTLVVFILAFLIMGCGFGFIYSSHLYYGAYGTVKRSVQMVIHEGVLSMGIVFGSGSGGYLAGNFSPYHPYWFILLLLAVGLIIQIILLPRK